MLKKLTEKEVLVSWNSSWRMPVNGKIKCRKSVKLNVGFPTFFKCYNYHRGDYTNE